jgi:hypothetical protein
MTLVRSENIIRNFGPGMGPLSTFYVSQDSVNSLKDSKKQLILRSNPYYISKGRMTKVMFDPRFEPGTVLDATYFPLGLDDPAFGPLINNALARVTGKVRKHNASLGVTLGSWRESRNMIRDRASKIATIFDRRADALQRQMKALTSKQRASKRREFAKGRASDFLEGEFGWVPLVQDIQAGFGALAQKPESKWISSVSKAEYRAASKDNFSPGDTYRTRWSEEGTLRVTVGGRCDFDSPNAFLANRLGLLNLPGVAWDLVPWSFVVNMFTNMGQMANSVTDFVGVTTSNVSTTKTSVITRDQSSWATTLGNQRGIWGYADSQKLSVRVKRDISSNFPKPSFQLRVPELNLELALIAISLILQKMNRINKLAGSSPINFTFPR